MKFTCFWHLIFIHGQCSQPSSPMEFAWFHFEFIQGSCQGNLIYHGICMLLASNLYSGSVLPTLSPMEFAWFHSEFIQGCQGNLICHMLFALNQSLFKVNNHSQCSSPSLSPSPHPPRAAVANDHHHHHHTTTTTTTTTTIPFSAGPSILGTLFARNASFFIQ